MSLDQVITIVTHDGTFHMDDLLSVALIKLLLGKNNQYNINRTRNIEVINKADWVVDVGQVYDHNTKRYDHHQLDSPVRDNGVAYASIGLLWRHYGKELCSGNQSLADKIDREFIQMIDGPDNGVETVQSLVDGGYPPTLSMLTRVWLPLHGENLTKDEQFFELLDIAETFFDRLIKGYVNSFNDNKLLNNLYDKILDRRIIELPYYIHPDDIDKYPELLYLVYPSEDKWKARCVADNFKCKLGFPNEWRGLKHDKLQKMSGVLEAEFVHKAGFLAVASTKEGVIRMCQLSINNS